MTSKLSAVIFASLVLMPVSAVALPAEGAGISVPDPSISDGAIQTTLEEIAALDPNLTLETVASKLGGVEGIEISGHTDSVGPDDENYILGKARANTVRAWLIAHGDFEANQVTAISMGETDPVIANLTEDGVDSPEARAQNRRVEFHIIEDAQADQNSAS